MSRLDMLPRTTEMFEDNVATQIARSHEGMAHFAGTGPEKAMCCECEHFRSQDKGGNWTRSKSQPCQQFIRMMKANPKRAPKKLLKIPRRTPACKYFEPA